MNTVQKYGKYTWVGLLGSVLVSHENGVSEGDVKNVRGRLVYAYRVRKKLFSTNEVHWCLVGRIQYEDISKYKTEIFGA